MPIDRPGGIDHFREAPLSPHLRWLEIARRTALELLRLKQRAKILAAAHPDEPEVFHGFERETLQTIGATVCEGLGWRVTNNADLPRVDPEDRFVYFSNHPTLTAVWPWGAFMEKHFGSNIVAVGKKEVIDNPLSHWFLGGLMLTAQKGIFIDRSDHEGAIEEIRNHARSILTSGTGAVIFPDEHRPRKKRIERQHKEWSEKNPHLQVGGWMTETCFPKSGGLWNFARAIDGLERVRFLDCTIVEPRTVYRFGGELHFDVREISRSELFGSPETEHRLRQTLVDLWKRKNTIIRTRRG